MAEFYKQCQLRKDDTFTTAWIPERGAKVGKRVELKPSGEFWNVISVSSERRKIEDIREREQDHKHQRKASDI